jgi:hypothetical protein
MAESNQIESHTVFTSLHCRSSFDGKGKALLHPVLFLKQTSNRNEYLHYMVIILIIADSTGRSFKQRRTCLQFIWNFFPTAFESLANSFLWFLAA